MWLLFGSSFQKNLSVVLGYDKVMAKDTAARAKRKYKEIIASLPTFERGDIFLMNIVSCAMFSAFCLNLPERHSLDKMTAYYRDSMMTGAMCCQADIINYGNLPYTDFIRKKTLCRGGDLCDFRFVRHETDAGDGWERTESV